ncbi:MAG: ABC transporter ATP-binding protein/permease [Acidovorax sp.]
MKPAQHLRRAAAILPQAWALSSPYFGSERKWSARGLLAAIVALNLAAVYMLVQINEWNRLFYDALQQRNESVFWTQLGRFALIALAYIVIAVYKFYLTQRLQLDWRRWLTQRMMARWLEHKAFYRLELARFQAKELPDNPDQRIQEDLNLFTTYTVSLAMGVLNAAVTFVSFVGILWSLSAGVGLDLFGRHWEVPGFMLWVAVLYCLAGTAITFWVGRPQVQLNYRQQRLEADFRHRLVRVREHSEAIALEDGERVEGQQLGLRFSDALANYLTLIKQQKNLIWFTTFFGQAAVVFPFIVAAPRFFSGAIQLGELMQIASAFGRVQDSLSWIVDNYSDIAAWRATTERLSGFEASLTAQGDAVALRPAPGERLHAEGLDVQLPNGAALLRGATLNAAPGDAILVSGPSGSGKSTLLRAFAGIWPFARAAGATRPRDAMFIPQRPYFPDGPLRDALAYPEPAARYTDDALRHALNDALLPQLAGRLDDAGAWNAMLSGGEQQRLAIARVLLKRPAWVLADEATSALDTPAERTLYQRLAALTQERGGALVSVAHRDSVQAFHRTRWRLVPDEARVSVEPL